MVLSGKVFVSAAAVQAFIRENPFAYALENALFGPDERQGLRAVQAHLLPSEPGSPGAAEIHATEYLELALKGMDVDPKDADRIRAGLHRLEAACEKRFSKPFVGLEEGQREQALRGIEDDDDGFEWLTLLMGYTIEAYVGDPAYGGNPNGIVWEWLGHRPGFPRPEAIAAERRR